MRPEILFGDSKVPSSSASNHSSASQINPLSLLSNLTGFPPGLNLLNNLKSLEEGSGNSMKDEFKEMLKLFGVSPEVAENLLPSGEQRQGEQQTLVLQTKAIQRFVITEKAPTRACSWLKAATTAFTFKTLLRHYAKRALTPRSLKVKLGPRRNYHKGRAAIRHYANQTAHP